MSMKYRTVMQSERSYLEEHVNALLAKGWTLQGDLVVTYCGEEDGCSKFQFTQALVLPSREPVYP